MGLPEVVAVTMARNLRSQTVMRRIGTTADSAEDVDAPDVDAVRVLGGEFADFEGAERAGLVEVSGGRISFVHPLMRTAVLAHADVVDRRAAHRALACSELLSAEAHAWHLAWPRVGPTTMRPRR
jgi:hypothetical protein